ncbi:MAG: hydrogenase maturation nickel metallochaperone HypA [Bacteroidota bacterium]
MHELSIAQNILEVVKEHVPTDPSRRVKSVTVKVGDGAGVVLDSLEFCFDTLIAGTQMQGTVLKIEQVPFVLQCNSCGEFSTNEREIFICSFCSGSDLKMISGNELQVAGIELFDEKEMTV